MNEERRFNVRHGLSGCLVAWLCLVTLGVGVSLVLTSLFGVSNEIVRIFYNLIWLFSIGTGGYVAARLGKTTGWTNSLVVGVLAELMLIVRLKRTPGTPIPEQIVNMISDPGAHWLGLVQLGLTIPAAIVGGIIWKKTGRVQISNEEES